jgi:hypothetical protein
VLFTGVTPLEIDAEKSLYYRGIKFRNDLRGSSNLLNATLRKENVTAGEIVAAYRKANAARFRVSNQMHQAIEDMKTMGLSKRKIDKILNENNIGGVDGILSNKYEPLYPSDTMLDIMKKNGTLDQYPKKDILRMYREFKKMKFTVDEPRTTAPTSPKRAPLPSFNPRFQNNAPPSFNPRFQRQGSLPQPTFPVTTARAPGPVNPALLGDDPFSAAANAQIANRLG